MRRTAAIVDPELRSKPSDRRRGTRDWPRLSAVVRTVAVETRRLAGLTLTRELVAATARSALRHGFVVAAVAPGVVAPASALVRALTSLPSSLHLLPSLSPTSLLPTPTLSSLLALIAVLRLVATLSQVAVLRLVAVLSLMTVLRLVPSSSLVAVL